MTEVWFTKRSITVVHLDSDCPSLSEVDDEDLDSDEVRMADDGTFRDDPSMRLCGHCARRKEIVTKSMQSRHRRSRMR